MKPYVYLIGWKKLDTWYCGVRFSKRCNPNDLWKTYFTSSKFVSQFRQENGEPDHIEILKEFDNREDALIFEEKKLREFNVLKEKNWLNRNICGHKFKPNDFWSDEYRTKIMQIKGHQYSEETKRRISEGLKGRKLSPEHIKNRTIAQSGKLRGPRSEETKSKLREARKKQIMKPVSEETRRKCSAIRKEWWINKKNNYVTSI